MNAWVKFHLKTGHTKPKSFLILLPFGTKLQAFKQDRIKTYHPSFVLQDASEGGDSQSMLVLWPLLYYDDSHTHTLKWKSCK